ncbi:Predicted nucleic acid-binding protein, contains PIN domain [Mesorhizobium albiziae]|uniref:Ribonuclease VapC n=1 Tax=Neomesorhizobium albiziae TaxID=335020 RepID=A0A1I4DQN0_9HYPH|nr:PIN domain-containing protein [Mesorhizobium albiziae]GLS33723.1 twitching motility protein PilT [Mesorhizobium albiziae]SFK95988.1 Predicted nucleic acid-binding protein, contains PIN domain [Mesorhizobium albiziae]
MPVFLDTNILLYSVSTAPEESAKREKARLLLDGDDCALSVQVLQEFYVQATRGSRLGALSHALAVDFISTWMRFSVQDNTLALFQDALQVKTICGFSFWDCSILAAARAQNCRELMTEDLAHGREIAGVRINNPFL